MQPSQNMMRAPVRLFGITIGDSYSRRVPTNVFVAPVDNNLKRVPTVTVPEVHVTTTSTTTTVTTPTSTPSAGLPSGGFRLFGKVYNKQGEVPLVKDAIAPVNNTNNSPTTNMETKGFVDSPPLVANTGELDQQQQVQSIPTLDAPIARHLTDETFPNVPLLRVVKQEPQPDRAITVKLETVIETGRKRDREEDGEVPEKEEENEDSELAEPQPKKSRRAYGSCCDYWNNPRTITIKHYVQAMEDIHYKPRPSNPPIFYRPPSK